MEDFLINAQVALLDAEKAMMESRFHIVAEKYQESSQQFKLAASITQSPSHRKHYEGFSLIYTRKAQEAEAYLQASNHVYNSSDYGLTASEDSESEGEIAGSSESHTSSTSSRKATPSLDVDPNNARKRAISAASGLPSNGAAHSAGKSPSAEELSYAAQLEKRISSSPLTALALGLQTVKDLVLGAKASILPSPSSKPSSSLNESFFLITDSSTQLTERELKLQEELLRVKGELNKIQTLLDHYLREHSELQMDSRRTKHTGAQHNFGPAGKTPLMKEAQMRVSLRDSLADAPPPHVRFLPSPNGHSHVLPTSSYIVSSSPYDSTMVNPPEVVVTLPTVSMPSSDPTSEINRLKQLLAASEKKNEEWTERWNQVKAKAMQKKEKYISQSLQSSSPQQLLSVSEIATIRTKNKNSP